MLLEIDNTKHNALNICFWGIFWIKKSNLISYSNVITCIRALITASNKRNIFLCTKNTINFLKYLLFQLTIFIYTYKFIHILKHKKRHKKLRVGTTILKKYYSK